MKIRTITRTITTKYATVLTVNTAAQTFQQEVFALPVDADETNALQMCRDLCGGDVVPVKLVKIEAVEQLYSMPESVFIKYATPVDSRCSKKEKESD